MNKRKSVLVVDVTGIYRDNKLYAHMPKVAGNYYEALTPHFDVKIAGGPIYTKTFGGSKVFELPYDCNESLKKSKISRFAVKIHEFLNSRKTFKSGTDILIFQCYSRMLPILLAALLYKKKNQNMFMIQYFVNSNLTGIDKIIESLLLKLCRKKVTGIICSSEKVGNAWKFPFCTVPDYFYLEECKSNKFTKYEISEYDFGMFGLMGNDKNIESILRCMAKIEAKGIIAGRFYDQKRYEKCKQICPNNVTLINRYLDDDEYEALFENTKVIMLPYSEGYNNHSSGVVLDAIYHKKPVITTDMDAFSFIRELNLGLLYSSEEEMMNAMTELVEEHSHYTENIKRYLDTQHNVLNEFYVFLEQ